MLKSGLQKAEINFTNQKNKGGNPANEESSEYKFDLKASLLPTKVI